MKTKFYPFAFMLLGFFSCTKEILVEKGPAGWGQTLSMSDLGRNGGASASTSNKGYVGFGNASDGTYLQDFWEYDPACNKWTRLPDYPGKGGHAVTSFSINGKVYVCLGFSNDRTLCNDVWEYTPQNNTWTQKKDFPGQARYSAKCFVIGSYAYVGSGSYNSSSSYLSDFWRYDPATDQWMRIADIPGGRCGAVAFSIDGKGYCGLGIDQGGSYLNALKDFWEYDPTKDMWSQLPDFPGLRYGAFGFGLNHKGYVGGGFDNRYYYNDMWALDPLKRSWEKVETPCSLMPRMGATSFTIKDNAYIGTGENNITILSDFWSYQAR